jgi:hypothetical protein
MEVDFTTRRLLVLRKLTRAVSETLRSQLKGHLSTLSPLLRPRTVFGEFVQSTVKEVVKGSDKSFKDLQTLFDAVVRDKPFLLNRGLAAPFEVESTTLEISPFEYRHVARSTAGQESKTIQIACPLKWVVTYSNFSLSRLRDILADRNRSADEVYRVVLHLTLLSSVFTLQPGLVSLLEALRFSVKSERWPEFGSLPITCITTAVSTVRPPDDVIIESTEISGSDSFEEVVRTEDIVKLRDPFHDKLAELVEAHDPSLLQS